MSLGASNRKTASTKMNDYSSRSHSIFMMTLSQRHVFTETRKSSKLYLVDLAGSEKVKHTEAKGARLEEAKKINRSLTTLGIVITRLTDGSSHIPYRDSKLTRVLQESLGGNSRTALIVCCSPSARNYAETLSTLRFGMRAKLIENTVRLNISVSVTELKTRLANACEENNRLRKLLQGTGFPLENMMSRDTEGGALHEENARLHEELESYRKTAAAFEMNLAAAVDDARESERRLALEAASRERAAVREKLKGLEQSILLDRSAHKEETATAKADLRDANAKLATLKEKEASEAVRRQDMESELKKAQRRAHDAEAAASAAITDLSSLKSKSDALKESVLSAHELLEKREKERDREQNDLEEAVLGAERRCAKAIAESERHARRLLEERERLESSITALREKAKEASRVRSDLESSQRRVGCLLEEREELKRAADALKKNKDAAVSVRCSELKAEASAIARSVDEMRETMRVAFSELREGLERIVRVRSDLRHERDAQRRRIARLEGRIVKERDAAARKAELLTQSFAANAERLLKERRGLENDVERLTKEREHLTKSFAANAERLESGLARRVEDLMKEKECLERSCTSHVETIRRLESKEAAASERCAALKAEASEISHSVHELGCWAKNIMRGAMRTSFSELREALLIGCSQSAELKRNAAAQARELERLKSCDAEVGRLKLRTRSLEAEIECLKAKDSETMRALRTAARSSSERSLVECADMRSAVHALKWRVKDEISVFFSELRATLPMIASSICSGFRAEVKRLKRDAEDMRRDTECIVREACHQVSSFESEQRRSLQEQETAFGAERSRLLDALSQSERKLSAAHAELGRSNARASSLEASNELLSRERRAADDKHEWAMKQLQNRCNRIVELELTCDELREDMQRMSISKGAKRRQLAKQLETLQARMEEMACQVGQGKRERSDLCVQNAILEKKLERRERELSELKVARASSREVTLRGGRKCRDGDDDGGKGGRSDSYRSSALGARVRRLLSNRASSS